MVGYFTGPTIRVSVYIVRLLQVDKHGVNMLVNISLDTVQENTNTTTWDQHNQSAYLEAVCKDI